MYNVGYVSSSSLLCSLSSGVCEPMIRFLQVFKLHFFLSLIVSNTVLVSMSFCARSCYLTLSIHVFVGRKYVYRVATTVHDTY